MAGNFERSKRGGSRSSNVNLKRDLKLNLKSKEIKVEMSVIKHSELTELYNDSKSNLT